MLQEKQIRALENYRKAKATDLAVRAAAVHDGISGNPNFSAPPIGMADFKAAIERLSALNAESLDGSKKIIAERNRQKEVVIGMLRLLGCYVEAACDGDIAVFRSSGLEPASSTKPQAPPLSQNIRNVEHGSISGQIVVWMKAIGGAFSYEFRYSVLDAGMPPTSWTTRLVTNVKRPIILDGLTPSATYAFEAHALLKEGYSDWSDMVTFMCT
jgi:hypothetical protein